MHPAKRARITTALPAALVLALGMLMSFASQAAALGEQLILSRLGDPVEVEIALAEWQDIDLDQVQISAGTPSVYESFGLDYQPALDDLNFNLVGPNLDGEVKVLVSSREPMHEPYLELLLVLRWPGGSLLREYVLLFDPPQVSQTGPAVSPQPPATPTLPVTTPSPGNVEQSELAAQVATASETRQDQNAASDIQPLNQEEDQNRADEPVAQTRQTVTVREIDRPVATSAVDGAVAVVEVQDATEPGSVSIQQGGTYTVESGDNLWDIATRYGPPNADLYQILLSIYQLNRGSFVNGNISLLKYGVTLRLPASEDVARIDPANAKTLFDQLWNEGSERIGMLERGEPLPPVQSILLPEVARSEVNPTAPVPGNMDALPAEASNGEPGVASTTVLVPALTAGPGQSTTLVPALAAGPGQSTTPGASLTTSPRQASVPVVSLAPAVDSAGNPVPQAVTDDTAAASSANPYLDGINASAQFMQEMLRAKQQQVELLEVQMAAMNTRMLEIGRVTERLNTSLDEALAERDQRRASERRNTFLLGGLVGTLSLAVIAIIVMALRLATRIRVQHELLQSAIQGGALAAAQTAAPAVKPESPKPHPDSRQTANVPKSMAPAHALSVSIIEEESEMTNAASPDDVETKPELTAAKARMDAQLGDMKLDQSENSES